MRVTVYIPTETACEMIKRLDEAEETPNAMVGMDDVVLYWITFGLSAYKDMQKNKAHKL